MVVILSIVFGVAFFTICFTLTLVLDNGGLNRLTKYKMNTTIIKIQYYSCCSFISLASTLIVGIMILSIFNQ